MSEDGRSLRDGLSSLRDEAGKPSSPKASIPSAVSRLIAALKPWEDDWLDMGMPACVPDEKLMLDADGVGGELITVGHWRELIAALAALRSPYSVENGGYLGPVLAERAAQAIEARRAETGTGSVHESAVAASDAPNPNPNPNPNPESPAQPLRVA